MKPFTSTYAPELERFVALRKSLGFSFDTQANILHKFDRHVAEMGHQGLLTQELALSFAGSNPDLSERETARRYQVVRHFSDFLALTEHNTPRLDPAALKCSKERPPARILTGDELARILAAARCISRRHPMRGSTLHTMIGLAVCTGLRINEVAKLDLSDLDVGSGTLLVRRTKFSKDRIVPLHKSALEKLKGYIASRNAEYPSSTSPALFLHLWGRRFSKHSIACSFRETRIKAGFTNEKKAPSFHSLRHTFAVNRLATWYREERDVQAMLPVLATYMGHVHYTDTAWYLSATPELLELAANRYRDFVQKGQAL